MKAFFVPLFAVALAAAPAPGRPEPVGKGAFALHTAVARGLQSNIELRVQALEVSALQAKTSQAGAMPNPSLEYLREGRHEQGGSTSLQLAIPLEGSGKRGPRIDAAHMELEAAALDLAALRLRIQSEIIAAFHETYLAQRRLELATATTDSANRSALAAARKVAAGKISPVEETRARIAESTIRIEEIQARRELAEARYRLAAMLGAREADLPALAVPEAALPVAPPAELIAARLADGPLMRRAAAEVDLRAALARVERSRRMPDVSLIVGQKRDGMDRHRQAIFGLSVPLPLFDRNAGAILEAERRTEKSRTELQLARQRLETEALQAVARLQAALEQEQLARLHILPGALAAYEASGKGFEAGKFSLLEVLDAQRSYFQAQALQLRTSSDAHRAAADLARLVGPATAHMQPSTRQETQ